MSTLALKLLLMPPLIGLVTLAARRWGATVGGWIGGLPWVAGPISLFLALEQGPLFAAHAAVQALAATVGVAGFCRMYVVLAPRYGWVVCTSASYAVYLAVVWGLSDWPLSLGWVYAAVLVVMAGTLATFPHPVAPPARPAPAFDIPLRMVVATVFVVGITKAAEWLGPAWSGLLTPFPIMTSILAAFTQQQQGWQASTRILRGLMGAMFGFATFLLAIAWGLPRYPLGLTYALALVITLALNALTLRVLNR